LPDGKLPAVTSSKAPENKPGALSLATAKRGVLFLEVPSKKWSQAPRFRKSDLPKLGDLVSIRQVYGFYGVSIGEAPAENSPKSGAGQLSGTGRETPEGVAKPGGLRLASDLVGRGVVNGRQEKLGTVTDFLLDFSGKKPLMVIITAKGLLKPSEYFAVPLRTLRPNGEGGFLLDATRIMLQRAVLLDDRSWRESPAENAVYRHCAR